MASARNLDPLYRGALLYWGPIRDPNLDTCMRDVCTTFCTLDLSQRDSKALPKPRGEISCKSVGNSIADSII